MGVIASMPARRAGATRKGATYGLWHVWERVRLVKSAKRYRRELRALMTLIKNQPEDYASWAQQCLRTEDPRHATRLLGFCQRRTARRGLRELRAGSSAASERSGSDGPGEDAGRMASLSGNPLPVVGVACAAASATGNRG